MPPLLARAQRGELWIADRNFSTRMILSEWDRRDCAFIVREHARTPNPAPLGELTYQGGRATRTEFEQCVVIPGTAGEKLKARRIELHLTKPADDGETVIRMLKNLP